MGTGITTVPMAMAIATAMVITVAIIAIMAVTDRFER
jgi:hypothetical protein